MAQAGVDVVFLVHAARGGAHFRHTRHDLAEGARRKQCHGHVPALGRKRRAAVLRLLVAVVHPHQHRHHRARGVVLVLQKRVQPRGRGTVPGRAWRAEARVEVADVPPRRAERAHARNHLFGKEARDDEKHVGLRVKEVGVVGGLQRLPPKRKCVVHGNVKHVARKGVGDARGTPAHLQRSGKGLHDVVKVEERRRRKVVTKRGMQAAEAGLVQDVRQVLAECDAVDGGAVRV